MKKRMICTLAMVLISAAIVFGKVVSDDPFIWGIGPYGQTAALPDNYSGGY